MDGTHLTAHFERIGARVRITPREHGVGMRLDIERDRKGEYFSLGYRAGINSHIQHVDEGLRHLLLYGGDPADPRARWRFLCGHDERHWFVAAVADRRASTVRQAMEALKPEIVRDEQRHVGLRRTQLVRRHTAAYVRQGEWFFIPEPNLVVKTWLIMRNEPLSRGFGKPHWAEQAYRHGGETVMVCEHQPAGLTLDAYRALLRDRPRAASWGWRPGRRNANVYVRGKIRHPDHATITLRGWHLVTMNTEHQAPWSSRVIAFID